MSKKSTTAIFDEDTPITQADIDAGRLVLRKRVEGRVALPKKRVTLYLDACPGRALQGNGRRARLSDAH